MDEKPIMGLVSDKNFIVSNAVENILAAPKIPSNTDKDYLKKDISDIHFDLFNTDYYIIGRYKAIWGVCVTHQTNHHFLKLSLVK